MASCFISQIASSSISGFISGLLAFSIKPFTR